MSLTHIAIRLMPAVIVALTSTDTVAAPKELNGKSIVVTWTEERLERQSSDEAFRPQTRNGEFSVYVSSIGNVFNRLSMLNMRRGKSGAVAQIGGKISFQGHSMSALQTQAGGAPRITATLDQAFAGCAADVIHGKQEGAAMMAAEG